MGRAICEGSPIDRSMREALQSGLISFWRRRTFHLVYLINSSLHGLRTINEHRDLVVDRPHFVVNADHPIIDGRHFNCSKLA